MEAGGFWEGGGELAETCVLFARTTLGERCYAVAIEKTNIDMGRDKHFVNGLG
jgi:hypothetical protein